MEELVDDVEKYSPHIFRANWQHKQLQKCLDNLQDGQLVMLMDYSENYRCRFQNESQNAYFDQQQVTIHPFMCYYMEKRSIQEEQGSEVETETKQKMVKHSVISNDTKHDAFAVHQFEKEAMNILQKQTEIKDITKFSDGAAAQYKGKNTFSYLSKSEIPTSRNYFETSHGKSPCDGLGAVVKQACFNAVKSEKAVIGNVTAAFEFCKGKLEHEKIVKKGNESYISRRNIVYVDRSDIRREEMSVKTLVGTRSIHAARSTNMPFTVEARNLSCFCNGCTENSEQCQHTCYVQQWTTHNIYSGSKKPKQPTTNMGHNQSTSPDGPLTPADTCTPTNIAACSTRADSALADSTPTDSATTDSTPADSTPADSTPAVGDFVLVNLSKPRRSRNIQQDFVARILEIDGNDIKLSYMAEKVIKKKFFHWLADEDISWEEISSVEKVLPEPELSDMSTNRNILFTFRVM